MPIGAVLRGWSELLRLIGRCLGWSISSGTDFSLNFVVAAGCREQPRAPISRRSKVEKGRMCIVKSEEQ